MPPSPIDNAAELAALQAGAAIIEASGKRLIQEWKSAAPPDAKASAEISTNAKGEVQWAIKAYGADPKEAADLVLPVHLRLMQLKNGHWDPAPETARI